METKETSINPIGNKVTNLLSRLRIINKRGHLKRWVIWTLIIVFILLAGTLPFHYVPSAKKVFFKSELTFKYTLITKKDINRIIRRYNYRGGNWSDDKTLKRRQSIENESLYRTLVRNGIIVVHPY